MKKGVTWRADKNMNDDLLVARTKTSMHKTWMKEYEDDGEEDSDEFDQRLGKSHSRRDFASSLIEAGTRLDLSDIHGGTLKPSRFVAEMKTSFLGIPCPLLLLVHFRCSRRP